MCPDTWMKGPTCSVTINLLKNLICIFTPSALQILAAISSVVGEGSCTLNHGSELKVQHPHTPVRPGGGCKTSATFHLHSPFASSEFVVELLAMQCLCAR